jgi:hypothetical protein
MICQMGDVDPIESPSLQQTRLLVSRSEWFALCLAVLAVFSFYGWTTVEFGGFVGDTYYNYEVRGFLGGHLWMDVPVDPLMLSAADPYNSSVWANHGGMTDTSYYHGHYYLYYGVVPVVLFLVPFKFITGIDPRLPCVTLLVASFAFLSLAWLWLRIRRDYFCGRGGPWGVGFTIALLGLGTGILAAVHLPGLYQFPIACGFLFTTLMLNCAYSAAHANRSGWWMAAAGLCLGLAAGSRPPMLISILGQGSLLVWLWRKRPGRAAPVAFSAALCAVMCSLLFYNYQRFGDPLEFGLRYFLTSVPHLHRQLFGVSYAAYNLNYYFFAGLHWSRYFPFVELPLISDSSPSVGSNSCGLFRWALASWFAIAAPLALLGRKGTGPSALGAVLGMLFLTFLGPAVFYTLFQWAALRYAIDFVPYLVLLAAVGFLALDARKAAASRATWTAAVLFTVFVACFSSITIKPTLLTMKGHAYYSQLARRFNVPAYWYERLRGWKYGPATLSVVFPVAPRARAETLISTPGASLVVDYPGSGEVRLGMRYRGTPDVLWGKSMPVEKGKAHRIDVTFGSLYPLPEHPFYSQYPWMAEAHSTVRAAIDGEEALRDVHALDPADCADIRVAGSGPAAADGFSGQVLESGRDRDSAEILLRSPPATLGPAPGSPAEIGVHLPFRSLLPLSLDEPMLLIGDPRAGDFVIL